MSILVQSTRHAPARDRFAFWHDAVCRAVLSVSVEPEAAASTFFGHIEARRSGRASFAAFRSTPHTIQRSKQQAGALDNDGYLLSLQLSGEAWMTQGERRMRLAPGELGILDGARPFSIHFPQSVDRMVAVIPRRMLEARAPEVARDGAAKLALPPPVSLLLRDTLRILASSQADLDDPTALRLCDNVCNLLASATGPEGIRREVTSAVSGLARRRNAVERLIGTNAVKGPFGPGDAAAKLGISVRSVHKALEGTGHSFGSLVLQVRLEACRTALGDPADTRSISAIALDYGFSEISHFNHAFRRLFGEAPGRFRVPR
jgi:AraC-like DNA-binding protein